MNVEAFANEIWELLEEGRSDEAVSRALAALDQNDTEPEFHFLLALGLLDLDEVEAAMPAFERSVDLSPDWPEAQAGLAWARFRLCRFPEADEAARKALVLAPDLAEAHQLVGLLAERRGEEGEALVSFAEARRLDPDRFPEPYELSEEEFLDVARETVAELDEEIRKVLEETSFFVQDVPEESLLKMEAPPLDPQLLGLFAGRSLLDRSSQDSGTLPSTLYLFRKNLERVASSREELEDEIRITVLHEIGHYLGWDEDELAERGLA